MTSAEITTRPDVSHRRSFQEEGYSQNSGCLAKLTYLSNAGKVSSTQIATMALSKAALIIVDFQEDFCPPV